MTKVLYVDDDPSYLEIVQEILQEDFTGVECWTAETATEGIAIVREGFVPLSRAEKPTLILYDREEKY